MFHLPTRSIHPADLEPGDKIAVRFGGVLSHYGIVTHSRTVLTNSARHGGVVEQSIAEFSEGRPIRLCRRTDHLDAIATTQRARRAKGSDYTLAGSNCSNYARWSHRQKPTTIQRARATLMALEDLLKR